MADLPEVQLRRYRGSRIDSICGWCGWKRDGPLCRCAEEGLQVAPGVCPGCSRLLDDSPSVVAGLCMGCRSRYRRRG